MDKTGRLGTFIDLMEGNVSPRFAAWLDYNDFFAIPASIHHHGNQEGGLFDHSLVVAETLVDLTKDLGLEWKKERSPLIVGMFHDLCKINNYVPTEGGWDYNKEILIPGHGERSLILLQQFIQLTEEEIVCIRWHMGAFDDKSNWDYYSRAVKKFPNVLWTHTADMVASQIRGV